MTTNYDQAVSKITAAITLLEADENPANAIIALMMAAKSDLDKGRFLDTEALSARWGMAVGTLGNLRIEGGGPDFIRPGGGRKGTVIYAVSDVEKYEEKLKTKRN